MKKTLLQLNTSLYSANGLSTRLADEFVADWQARNPGGKVIVRDLARDPLPHLTAERFQAFTSRPEERTAEQRAVIAESDALIRDLVAADVIVLGVPMYNFGVPSTLKTYFDHVARAGVTFRYSENGPVGLLTGKQAYVLSTRGGFYAGTPGDTETVYVRQFLGFLGIKDVEFVYAEGLAINETSRIAGLARAKDAIARLNGEQRELVAA
nr:AzoR2 [uncultured bacterium]